ncbi:type VI secretion system baseplate subunit TssE [Novosphingobium sp.]|uniref:type VI secretion system baseplate subunit TssE n=1 Tax=Novosphingobium sp. TaxID=1874826 RepID=UPI003B51C8CD
MVSGNVVSGTAAGNGAPSGEKATTLTTFSEHEIDRFNESGLRASVKRELAWLLNTTNLGAAIDLEPYPHVKTSVLNYGVPDLAGKSITRRLVMQRARDIRKAVQTFEPRFAENSLTIDVSDSIERENAVTFVIQGNIGSALQAIPVKLRTDVESDTAAVTVRD